MSPLTPDRANLRQQLADAIGPTMRFGLQDAELYDEPGAQRIEEWVTWISGALLPVVEAHAAAAVRRALEGQAACPSKGRIDDSECALPAGHGSHHRNKQGNYYWDDSHAVASPARGQGEGGDAR